MQPSSETISTMMRPLLLTLGVFALGAWTEPPRSMQPAPTPCRVVHIVDGDTLDCASGVRVRLRGVDTPERGEPRYREASDALRRLVFGQAVTLIPHHGNRGRIVADVMLRGLNVGVAMDRAGWSKPSGARR